MTLKNDSWISYQSVQNQLITPFIPELISKNDDHKVISYGLSSYGYDIRLSDKDFQVFETNVLRGTIDPKEFDQDLTYSLDVLKGEKGDSFFMMPHTFAMGVSLEKIKVPDTAIALVLNKSTYARCGLDVRTTVLEPGWIGHVTLEFNNATAFPLRLYANEGIAQVVFLEGDPCITTYGQRRGKYNYQPEEVVYAK